MTLRAGYIPSPIDDRDLRLVGDDNALFGATSLSPPGEHYGLIQHLDFVNDQQTTESCVWNAIQTQHYIALGHRGVTKRERLSRLFGYWFSRFRHGGQKLDIGTIPREAWKAAATMGFCKESLWPFDIARVNDKPDFDAISGAIDQQWVKGYYNIYGVKYARDEEVRMAISKGHPVVFGSMVNKPFLTYREAHQTDALEIPRENPIGRHMMCAVAYDDLGLWVVNSWGLDWGAADPTGKFPAGFFRMSWDWVNWSQATDFWAVDYAIDFA